MEKIKFIDKKRINYLPRNIGIYVFKKNNTFLYIGKSINIRQRVIEHFKNKALKDAFYTKEATKVGYLKTNSEIKALLKEAELIKRYKPKYNTIWKDNKNFSFVEITKEKFPRIFITHQPKGNAIGPFVGSKGLKITLRLLRKIFPYRTCNQLPKKACLYQELKLCPAPCVNQKDYKENIVNIQEILKGKSKTLISQLKKEMRDFSRKEKYEEATEKRNQIFALENIFLNAQVIAKDEWQKIRIQLKNLLGKEINRIEGYDVSNIQGKQAVGSMVVFEKGKPKKEDYRKFKIKTCSTPNDTAMLAEIIQRRFKHKEWNSPQAILIDGGKGQLSTVRREAPTNIKIMSLAKKNNELFLTNKPILLKDLPKELSNLMLNIRDESHRFAISYHKKIRSKEALS